MAFECAILSAFCPRFAEQASVAASHDFESSTSANSATLAFSVSCPIAFIFITLRLSYIWFAGALGDSHIEHHGLGFLAMYHLHAVILHRIP